MSIVVALDYDNTYTLDPMFWDLFIEDCKNNDWEVVICTYRDDRFDTVPDLTRLAMTVPVYFTRGAAKKWWMEQFAAFEHCRPAIWIDDRPETIFENSSLNRDQLEVWRTNQEG
jgi:hypothetical protein